MGVWGKGGKRRGERVSDHGFRKKVGRGGGGVQVKRWTVLTSFKDLVGGTHGGDEDG